MSLTYGISGMFGGLKASGRKQKLGSILEDASAKTLPFLTAAGGELKKWGQEDWDKFKTTYRPAAEALVADANQAPDYGRGERESSLSTARGVSGANADVRRAGINPASGRFARASTDISNMAGRSAGVGGAVARQRADQVAVGKKLNVIGLGGNDPASSIAALGFVSKGGKDYGKYSGIIGRSATESLGGAAQGLGTAVGSYRARNNQNTDGPNSTPPNDYQWGGSSGQGDANSQNEAFGDDYSGPSFAEGGIIRGPGSGRSDSIPAVIDGRYPARVSNGEHKIPKSVVAAIGRQRLDALIEISRSMTGAN